MGFHQQLQQKADRIFNLANEDIFGIVWIQENGSDWYREFGRIAEGDPDDVADVLTDFELTVDA